ncbi:MAG: hypothetical protein WAN23_04905 [Candidatus Acidiferrales bacterium]
MKKLFILLALLLVAPRLSAQTATLDTADVQKDIVFLYAASADGTVDKNHPLGTGFFLSVPRLGDPSMSYVFLVTARHIVDPQWANCGISNPQKIFYRVNKKSYDPSQGTEGVGYIDLPLQSRGNARFAVHTRDDIDVALIQLSPTEFNASDYDVFFLPIVFMASDDETKDVGIGDLIASGGLLPGASGSNRNYPLFRFGYISALPDEDLATPCIPGGPPRYMRLWLVEANLSPGASGSPVFYIPSFFSSGRKTIGRGVVIGTQSSSFLLADVAGVTPISYAFDIIEGLHLPDANLYRGNPPPSPATPPKPKSN